MAVKTGKNNGESDYTLLIFIVCMHGSTLTLGAIKEDRDIYGVCIWFSCAFPHDINNNYMITGKYALP